MWIIVDIWREKFKTPQIHRAQVGEPGEPQVGFKSAGEFC